ncbi:3'(2'),5'-bisphosphate nucleotidase [Halothiobacillus diazotrophicus]|uniref:3'(2'),5'-bisphosphate nucleotidase CysQ n=1 Tax=Halothiobacillus diazotrophicus TaxID=1860122 RepID=A0A191ZIC9_9GAMM|nr:3'(2'),5'-bisphosphate nucleotidase CysQ [Halothiobacillus diazotrophicus]ANJ67629.1 3'(2'),5'-bisphosphate nucleotidase [Halothiobacillus diazotrophicus]
MSEWLKWRDAVRGVAHRAGEAIMHVYAGEFSFSRKMDDSPVTEADLAAHRVIVAGLQALTPDIPVLTEEGGLPDWSIRQRWTRYWLVDPLDGTREFIKRNGEFSVNIALIDGHQSVMGVVYAPATGLDYAGVLGVGSWRFVDGNPQSIHVRDSLGEIVTLALSRSHLGGREQALIDALGDPVVVRCGSALKTCLVAEAGADLYPRFGPTSEWDTAASQCVLEAAGGRLVDLQGARLQYNRGASVLNPSFIAYGARLPLPLAEIAAIAKAPR